VFGTPPVRAPGRRLKGLPASSALAYGQLPRGVAGGGPAGFAAPPAIGGPGNRPPGGGSAAAASGVFGTAPVQPPGRRLTGLPASSALAYGQLPRGVAGGGPAGFAAPPALGTFTSMRPLFLVGGTPSDMRIED